MYSGAPYRAENNKLCYVGNMEGPITFSEPLSGLYIDIVAPDGGAMVIDAIYVWDNQSLAHRVTSLKLTNFFTSSGDNFASLFGNTSTNQEMCIRFHK